MSQGSEEFSYRALPPSFKLVSGALKALATYRLRAVVECPGWLTRRLSAVQHIEFRPLQPPRMNEQPRRLCATGHLSVERFGFKCSTPNDGSELPSYSPPVVFEVTAPSSNAIRPGDHLDLSTKICIPTELHQSPGLIWLQSLTIRLSTMTTGSAGCNARSHAGYVSVCSTQGFLPVEPADGSEWFAIPPQLWESHIYPQILPSFKSYGIQRSHRLEGTARIASNLTSSVRVSSLWT